MSRAAKVMVVLLALGVGMFAVAKPAAADVLDCTVGPGTCTGYDSALVIPIPDPDNPVVLNPTNFYWFNGALWSTGAAQNVGTGTIKSFARLNDNVAEVQGMNTSYRGDLPGLDFDDGQEMSDPNFTRDIQLNQVTFINLDDQWFMEYLLDLHQSGSEPFLALNNVEFCIGAAGGAYNFATCEDGTGTSPTTVKWNMDDQGSAEDYVVIDSNFNAGSGNGVDMHLYIPISVLDIPFGGQIDGEVYAYLWSHFGSPATHGGQPSTENSTFEEWAVRAEPGGSEQIGPPTLEWPDPPPCEVDCGPGGEGDPPPVVPEPASMLLLGSGLAGLGAAARRRRKK